ncbi:unnamed protein product [Parajaminaea phylloscopi]
MSLLGMRCGPPFSRGKSHSCKLAVVDDFCECRLLNLPAIPKEANDQTSRPGEVDMQACHVTPDPSRCGTLLVKATLQQILPKRIQRFLRNRKVIKAGTADSLR